jgi:hypothetical protein
MSGKKKFNLTQEQIKEFQRAAQATWQTIAYDCLQCTAEAEGKNINRVVIKKDEVIEIVLDADYILTYGGIKDPVVKDFYKNGDYDQMIEILNEDFKHARYGL